MTPRRLFTRVALATLILAPFVTLGPMALAWAAGPPFPTSVSIVGTPNVNVVNPASAPALTRDVDNPALQPVKEHLFASGSGHGPGSSLTTTTYTVPSGKRLVIEYVASQVLIDNVSSGEADLTLDVASGGPFIRFPLGAALTGFKCTLAQFCLTISSPVRIYAEADSAITLESSVNVPGVNDEGIALGATFAGYLVDVP